MLDQGGLAGRRIWVKRCQGGRVENIRLPVMSEGELSGTFKIVSQFWLLCADVPEHVGNARPPHVQAAVVLVRRLGALLAPLHRLDQFPDSTVYSLFLPIIEKIPQPRLPKFSLHLQFLTRTQVRKWVLK